MFSVSGDPSPEEGYPTVASLSRFRGPILLISSAEDPVFPPGTDAAIAAAHRGPETVLAIPGALHALALLDGPDGTKVRVALDRFLANVLA